MTTITQSSVARVWYGWWIARAGVMHGVKSDGRSEPLLEYAIYPT